MLFRDKLNEIGKKLSPEFDKLFDKIVESQSHDGDLLLVLENGLYNPDVHNWNNLDKKFSPYMIGPSHEGHSSNTHYKFIHIYRTNTIADITHSEYLKELEYTPEKREQIDQMQEIEGQSIQIEMLIYLKIWEADSFIKRFYQICRLLHGEPYDWHFKITESNRDSGATGNRQTLIRKKIRDRFQNDFPIIYKAFKTAYLTQVRNSIAHSKYSTIERNIHLNNYVKKDPASQLHELKFDEWIEMFHNTMIIYNEQIGLFKKIRKMYSEIAKHHNNLIQVRINRKDPEEKTEYCFLKYQQLTPEFGRWSWAKEDNFKNEK